MNQRFTPRRRGGFTLLELLIATAMASVLILSCYAALRVAFKARDSALAAVGPVRAGEAAMDIIRRDVESALPPTGRLASEFLGDQGLEVADTSQLLFAAVGSPAPGYLESFGAGASNGLGSNRGGGTTVGGGTSSGFANNVDSTLAGGIVKVAYLVRQSRSGSRVLVRQVQRNLLAQVENAEPDEEAIVCRNVRTFIVRYYDGTQYQDVWDSTTVGNALPMFVEVTLELDRPPVAAGASSAGNNVDAQHPYYSAVRTFFPACYDPATSTTGGLP